jgi:SAM-dependent methyltransferase
MGYPAVRAEINRRIGGGKELWPLDWFAATYPGRTFDRALSIGCGTGALERDLLQRELCGSIDAFDGSIASLSLARRAATRGGGDRIRYFAADFNRPAFPRGAFDAVFIHQALHHVAKLEKLLREILLALKPNGLLYLEEYVGPSRHAWTDGKLAPLARLYDELPRELRSFDRIPAPIQADDPSEAIRSDEIREQLAIGFRIEHERGYGGNLLAVILPSLDLERAGEATVRQLIAKESALLAAGARDFYAVIVGRPATGAAKLAANLRYFFEPKLKRLGREVRALIRR